MHYFDNASTTFPKPESVYKKFNEAFREYGANPGRSGHKLALRAMEEIMKTRLILAKLFNVDNPLNISFHMNTTYALNTAIKGALKKGDHVITTSMEHNSVLRPLFTLKEMGIIDLTVVKAEKTGEVGKDKIVKAIKDNTRMLVMTHSSNLLGTVENIDEISKAVKAINKDIIILIDAAQSAGIIDIDLKKLDIDMLATAGHKSLFGPQGTGVLYLRNPELVMHTIEGGTGSRSNEVYQPMDMPDKLEPGTPNGHGIIALGAGVEYILEEGIDNIRKHEETLTKTFIEGLKTIDGVEIYGLLDEKRKTPVVSMNMEGVDSSILSYVLDDEYDIQTRPGLHCAPLAHETIGTIKKGAVRFSFSCFNKEDEIIYAIETLKKIKKEAKDGKYQ